MRLLSATYESKLAYFFHLSSVLHSGGQPITGPAMIQNGDRKVISRLIWTARSSNRPEFHLKPEIRRALNAVDALAEEKSIKLESRIGDIQLID